MAVIIWLANPGSSDFNTAANWYTGTVPGANDTAVFDASTITNLTFSAAAQVGAFQFNAGAPAYSFTLNTGKELDLVGPGILDNSSNAPTFAVTPAAFPFDIPLQFFDGSSAGDATIIVNSGPAGGVAFDDGTPGQARLINNNNIGFANHGPPFPLQVRAITAGSIEGTGAFAFDDIQLTIGSNNLSTEFSGVMTGSFMNDRSSLIKVGTGQLTLASHFAYGLGGGFKVVNGILQDGDGGAGESRLSGNIEDDALLIVDHPDYGTYSGDLTGTGSVDYIGSGRTAMIGGTISCAGGMTIGAGIFELQQGDITVGITDNATFALNWAGGGVHTFSSNISGTGGVQQLASATIFTGTGTYTGGTQIQPGVLQLGNGGFTGSIAGNVVLSGGTLAIDRADTFTLNGVISGAGDFNQLGTGTTILTGTNTYGRTGNTAATTGIAAGTLEVAAGGSITGDVYFSLFGYLTSNPPAPGNGVLKLDSANGFNGIIYDFELHDKVDLSFVSYDPSINLFWQQTTSNSGALSLRAGSATLAALQFAGKHSSTDFKLSADPQGKTLVGLDTDPLFVRFGDAYGVGRDDILLQNDNGQIVVWNMNGGAVVDSQTPGSPGAGWHVRGTGDFNGDGNTGDVLLQNDNGQLDVWMTSGGQVLNSQSPGMIAADWHIRATGDFYGDGRTGVLLQNDAGGLTVWDMNGGQVMTSQSPGAIGPDWHIRGAGDFYGDGRSGILLQNDAGQLAFWDMKGGQVVNSQSPGMIGNDWHIREIGDFYGDGRDGVLLQNDSGAMTFWDMNGGQVVNSQSPGAIGSDWHIRGTGDFNGDGRCDLLLQNDSGALTVWDMNGGTVMNSQSPGAIDSTWHLV